MRSLRWLAVLPSVGGLTVSLMGLTAGAPAIAAQDAYGLQTAPSHVQAVQADPWAANIQPPTPLHQVDAALMAKIFARREAAKDRREAARKAARRAARRAARIAAQQASQAGSTVTAPITVAAVPDCPMSALGAMGRVDEGVDYMGAGPVYALGSGTVTYTGGGDWPGGGFIAYHLDNGNYVYLAEDVTSAVSVGERVHPGTVVGNAWGGGDGIETGWAMPPGNVPEAAAYNHYTDGVPTGEGYSFRSVLLGMGCG